LCVFITIGVTEKSKQELIDMVGRDFGLSPLSDEEIRRLFPSSETCLLITRGLCSCDLYAGEDSPERDREERSAAEDRKFATRARRKGWSEAKIQRAIEDQMSARERRPYLQHFFRFRDLLPQLVERLGAIRLYAREYGTREMSERPYGVGCLELTVENYLQRGGGYPLDHLVTIRAQSQR